METAADYRRRLGLLIQQVKGMQPQPDPEITAHLGQYLCVLTAGLIEVTIQEALLTYVAANADGRVFDYMFQHLDRLLVNLRMSKILDIADDFDRAWRDAVALRTAGGLSDAVTSVVANRNRIAHGEPVSLSLSQVEDYYSRTCLALDAIAEICG